MKKKVVDLSVSLNHSAFTVAGGYVLTIGDNKEAQLGLGHTKNAVGEPSVVKKISDKFINVRNVRGKTKFLIILFILQKVKCSPTYTVTCTESNVIIAWGTRYGIPEFHFNEVPPTPQTPSTFSQIGNNTAAFTNFLTSVYKSEAMLDPTELLGLYASNDLLDKGIYMKLVDVFPLQHSILVWVDTTTPLKTSK